MRNIVIVDMLKGYLAAEAEDKIYNEGGYHLSFSEFVEKYQLHLPGALGGSVFNGVLEIHFSDGTSLRVK